MILESFKKKKKKITRKCLSWEKKIKLSFSFFFLWLFLSHGALNSSPNFATVGHLWLKKKFFFYYYCSNIRGGERRKKKKKKTEVNNRSENHEKNSSLFFSLRISNHIVNKPQNFLKIIIITSLWLSIGQINIYEKKNDK